MRDYSDWTSKLADLLVGFGANVQPGQIVGVTTYVGKEALTREIVRAAYARGARYVDVVTFDNWAKRERLLGAAEETLDYIPPWLRDRLQWLSDEHAARISLSGPQSQAALAGIAPGAHGARPAAVAAGDRGDRQQGHDKLVHRSRADA